MPAAVGGVKRARRPASREPATRHLMPRNGIRMPRKLGELLRFRQNSAAMPIPASFML